MKNIYFYSVIIGFFLGIAIPSFFVFSSIFLIDALIILSGCLIFVFNKKTGNNLFKLFLVFLLVFFFGILRSNLRESYFIKNNLDNFLDKDLVLAGEIINSPKVKSDNIEAFFVVKSVLSEGVISKEHGQKIIVSFSNDNNISYGDSLLLSGRLKKIENFDSNESGRSFDYVSFMKKDGVLYRLNFPEVKRVDIQSGNILLKKLFLIKDDFVSNIENVLGEPSASLVSGMTIAGRGGISEELEDVFVKAGIIHIVVLSGFNLAIVAIFGNFVFGFFGRRPRSVLIVVLIFLFILMAGVSPPLLRAGIMATIMIFARNHNRKLDSLKLLFFAGLIMVFINPFILLHDPSFILSFLATFGVVFSSDFIEYKIGFVTDRFKARRTMAETLGASIFVYPYIAFAFGNLSLVSLPVNLLVLPLVPFIMLLGLIIGVFGSVGFVAGFFAIIVDLMIRYIIFICELFLKIPFAFLEVPAFSFFLCLIVYLSIFLFVFNKKKKWQKDF